MDGTTRLYAGLGQPVTCAAHHSRTPQSVQIV